MQTIDNLVIGGGICGTYCASRHINIAPDETLLLVDKLDNYGGNMISYNIPDTDIVLEYGPIRYYKSIHPRVAFLVEKYKIPVIEYLASSIGQVFYLRDKRFTPQNLFPDSDSVYNIRPDEIGVNPLAVVVENLLKYIKNPTDLYLLPTKIELFKNPELSSVVFKDLAQGTLSQENWQRVCDVVGFDDILDLRASFLINALEFLTLENKVTTQYRLTNGFNTLPRIMAKENNLVTVSFDSLNENTFLCNKHVTLFKTVVLNIMWEPVLKKWKVTLGKVNVDSPENINYTPISIKEVYVNRIYSTVPTQYISGFDIFQSSYINTINNSYVPFHLARYFLVFEEDWMLKDGIGFGRSVTTVDGAQLIHWAPKVLQIYAADSLASKIDGLLPLGKQLQQEVIPPFPEAQPFIDTLLSTVKQVFGKDELPKVTGFSYCSWVSCVRFLANRNLQTQQVTSLYDTIQDVLYPFGKQGNFYVMDNATSFNTTWAEGSLEIVDFLFNQLYNEPLFGEPLIK